MVSSRSVRLVVLTLVALVVQATYGPPARATAVLRAARCCAVRCHNSRSAAHNGHCCRVFRDSGVLATIAPVQMVPLPAGAGTVAGVVWGSLVVPGPALSLALSGRPRAAPLYLLTRTLRL
jgi:hypothetical protein